MTDEQYRKKLIKLKNMNDNELTKYVETHSTCDKCIKQCDKFNYNLDVCVKNVRSFLEKVEEK